MGWVLRSLDQVLRPVDHALGLALAALDRARLDQAQADANAEDVLDGMGEALAHVLEGRSCR